MSRRNAHPHTNQLTGTTFGTGGGFADDGNTVAEATDGNRATFFDGPTTEKRGGNDVPVERPGRPVATAARGRAG